jgi:hypothetical protein
MLLLLLVRTRLLTPVTEDLLVGEDDDEREDEEAGVFELKKLRPLRTRVVLPEAPDLMDELLRGLELACVRVVTDERLVLRWLWGVILDRREIMGFDVERCDGIDLPAVPVLDLVIFGMELRGADVALLSLT